VDQVDRGVITWSGNFGFVRHGGGGVHRGVTTLSVIAKERSTQKERSTRDILLVISLGNG
jgi:hypothetical protein